MRKRITHKALLQILRYCKTTGIFTWKKTAANIYMRGKRAGSLEKDGYVRITIDYRRYSAGPLAWFYITKKWPKKDVDHKNRVRNDNRWRNFRLATRSENIQNQTKKADTSSRFIGVTYDKSRALWLAHLHQNGKTLNLGRFTTQESAAKAYDKKIHELKLTWRPLNFGKGHRALSR